MAIHLGPLLPKSSSNLPGLLGAGTPLHFKNARSPYLVLLRGGVYHAIYVTADAVRSYRTFSPLPQRGGLFSVALSIPLSPLRATARQAFAQGKFIAP